MEDTALRKQLEEIAAANPQFTTLVNIWGPEVYQRNRILFRSLITSKFSFFYWDGKSAKRVPWNKALATWLIEVDANGDAAIARLLIQWKLMDLSNKGFRISEKIWCEELLQRFESAQSHTSRLLELEKMSFGWGCLDENTAMRLHALDPESSRNFILRYSPISYGWLDNVYGSRNVFWEKLITQAQARRDEALALALYKKQVPPKRWKEDALKLCQTIPDSQTLQEELERTCPIHFRNLGDGIIAILESRGRDCIPFVLRHLSSVRTGIFGRGDFGRVLKLAATNEWWDLWACAVRVCSNTKEFNEELNNILNHASFNQNQARERLVSMLGVSREWNFSGFGIAVVHNLDEENALALHERYPDLLRGPFKVHLHARWQYSKRKKLIERLIASGPEDENLLDFLASRFATNTKWGKSTMCEEVDQLADYYLQLREQPNFARRSAAVLGQIPAFAIYNYSKLIQENRLARLLFERSFASYLQDERAVADLVEASEIHVMALAYRILALDDERARSLVAQHLPLLLGTLFRPMHRVTRAAAFGALINAASTSEQTGRIILYKAKEALALPDKKYPKEELAGLIGQIIHRWPVLRGTSEKQVIYRRTAA